MGRMLVALKDLKSVVCTRNAFRGVPTCPPGSVMSTANYKSACTAKCLCVHGGKTSCRRTNYFTTTVSALGLRTSNPFDGARRSM